MPPRCGNDSTRPNDPWKPPDDGVAWFGEAAKRQNYIRLLEQHNELLYREAVAFIQACRGEIYRDTAGSVAA